MGCYLPCYTYLGGLIRLADAPVDQRNFEALLTNDGPFECILITLPVCFVIMTNHRKLKESVCGYLHIYIHMFEPIA